MRENEVEKQFVEAVRAAGGQALKFTSQSMNGVPDRLVLLLGGKCAFVELKAPGKQMRILQRKRRQQLEALGFPVFCVDRLEQIEPVVDALIAWNPGDPIPTGVGASHGFTPRRKLSISCRRAHTRNPSMCRPAVHQILWSVPSSTVIRCWHL